MYKRQDYGREVSKNSSLSERIYEVCAERDRLKGKVRDYERVRRAIGTEQADRILEAAYQQEQAEKERKRAYIEKLPWTFSPLRPPMAEPFLKR